jgi:hypothetical protein
MVSLLVTRIPAAIAGLVAVCLPLAAQTPTRVAQIPVVAGAVRQPDREAEVQAELPTQADVPPGVVVSDLVRVYRTSAPVEDVVRFYQKALAAREVWDEADREQAWVDNCDVGQTSPVIFMVDSVDLSPDAWAEQASGSGRSPQQYAAAVRAAYAKARPPFRRDAWLHGAYFEWSRRESESRGANLSISVQDVSDLGILDPSYAHVTEIEVRAIPWRSWEAAEEDEQAEAERAEEVPVEPMAAPSEAQLGVPIYPGARFEGRMSAELSQSDEEANYYVFGSADAAPAVTAFYRQRTGKPGIEVEGGVLIAVRGEGLFPDLAVTIQPNVGTLPASVKSVITVRKRR